MVAKYSDDQRNGKQRQPDESIPHETAGKYFSAGKRLVMMLVHFASADLYR